jgi:hypothetical protein
VDVWSELLLGQQETISGRKWLEKNKTQKTENLKLNKNDNVGWFISQSGL